MAISLVKPNACKKMLIVNHASFSFPFPLTFGWSKKFGRCPFRDDIIALDTGAARTYCWLSGVAVACQRCRASDPGSLPARTRLREIIPANNCTMQEQNNWGNWGSPGVMKLWVAWEVLRWLMKFRELRSGGFHPKLVTPPYHGFLNVNTPPNSQNSKRH